MRPTRSLIRDLALYWAMGCALLVSQVILLAHGNGGSLTITITQYGERYVEVVLVTVLWPVLALGLHYLLEDARR